MALPPVSRDSLIDALRGFDREERNKEEWQGWQMNANYEHAIQFERQLYPVKQIISLATGMPKDSFSGGPISPAPLIGPKGLSSEAAVAAWDCPSAGCREFL